MISPKRDLQSPFDIAVVIPTTLRPTLARAVESVYAQTFPGRVQILIGIDVPAGDPAMLTALKRRCPSNMLLTVLDLPYSTSVRHGGLYPNRFSGALRTILSFAANSRLVAYLDDDNWFGVDHLADLVAAMAGRYWAFSMRFFAEPETGEPICIDDWESVGPGEGVFKDEFGGFVDPSSLMLDKMICRDVLPLWSLSPFDDGTGEDRLVFSALADRFPPGRTGRATSYYTINPRDGNHPIRLQKMRERGVVLPAERRAGIRQLSDLAETLPRDSHEPAEAGQPSRLLASVMAHLRPSEAIVFARDGAIALTLDSIARASGLALLIAVVGEFADKEFRALRRTLGRAAIVLPPELGDGAFWLKQERVQVDLVYLGIEIDRSALETGWPLVREGGLMIASGDDAKPFEAFAELVGAKLLPAEIDGVAYWVVQKA